MNTTKLTTTNISANELKHLRKLAKQHGLKQVEFVNYAVAYFQKTGINPAAEIYSPREEIEMLRKRLEEVIKFQQVHEKQKLSPLLDHLIILEKKLSENYLSENFSKEIGGLAELMTSYKDSIEKRQSNHYTNLSSKLDLITTSINNLQERQLQTANLIGLLFNCLKIKGIMGIGGMNESDIKKFEDALYGLYKNR
jgi:hypothetical protein